MGPLFLGFIIIMLFASLALWFTRLDILKSERNLDSAFSREGIFLIQNFIFASAAFTVFVGTTFPILSEAVADSKITVGPPFYNQLVVPQFGLLVILMGIAPLMAWGKSHAQLMVSQARLALVCALLITLTIGILRYSSSFQFSLGLELLALSSFFLCFYTLTQTVIEYIRSANARVRTHHENYAIALLRMFQKNQRRYGGYLVHIGVVLIALGAVGKGLYGTDVVQNVKLNDSFRVGEYQFTYRGLSSIPCDFDDCNTIQSSLWVTRQDGKVIGNVYPHRDVYPLQQHTATIADTTGNLNEEVYVILSAWEGQGESATFQVYINPLINWIWIGGVVMILGFFAAFWNLEDKYLKQKSVLHVPSSKNIYPIAVIFISAVVFTHLLTDVTTIQAQSPDPNTDTATYHLAKQLNCPTCAGRNLADCPTDTCTQWKSEIKSQLDAGKNSQEVLAYFQARFGETVLQEPPKRGVTLILWVLPIIGLAILSTLGVTMARRSVVVRQKPLNDTAPIISNNANANHDGLDDYSKQIEQMVTESNK
jgi:cytochrome c-type biogenesis protein CcmH/NrfF